MENEFSSLYKSISHHILNDVKPSIFLNSLLENKTFISKYPFTMLSDLKDVEQSPVHHFEGNVWNHTLLVVDEAAKRKEQSTDKLVFMWAALLHDIGKKEATKIRKGKITAYDHDKIGAKKAKLFLKEFIDNEEFINKTVNLVRWHMQILYVVNNLPQSNLNSMKAQVSINEVALLGLCDRVGRGKVDIKKEMDNVRIFLDKCK